MKFLGIKKNIVACILAAIVTVGGTGTINAKAAEPVDKTAAVNITALVGKDDTSVFAQNYNGTVDIKLYKIADLDEAGNPKLLPSYEGYDIDLSVLKEEPTVADIEEKIVEKALKATEEKLPDDVIIASRKNDIFSGKVSINEGAGIYLYVPLPAVDDKYRYSFTSYVIYAPGNDYISSGRTGGEDKWNYDVSFILKPQETPLDSPTPEAPTTPTHEDEIIHYGEDVIEITSELPPLAGGNPKTGDSYLPLVLCGIALLLGLILVGYYFKTQKEQKKTM